MSMHAPDIIDGDDGNFLPWLPGDVWRNCDCGCRIRRFFCGTGLENRAEKSLDEEKCRGGDMLIMWSPKKCTLCCVSHVNGMLCKGIEAQLLDIDLRLRVKGVVRRP